MMNKNKGKNVNYTLIDSRKYYIKKVFGQLLAVIAILLGGAVIGRGRDRSFISLFIDVPFFVEILLFVFALILVAFSVALQFNKEKNKGEIQFDTDRLNLAGKEINLASTPVTVSLNASKEKRIYERTIKDSGANNWIELVQNGNTDEVRIFNHFTEKRRGADRINRRILEEWFQG